MIKELIAKLVVAIKAEVAKLEGRLESEKSKALAHAILELAACKAAVENELKKAEALVSDAAAPELKRLIVAVRSKI
jgi:hypothetical protein